MRKENEEKNRIQMEKKDRKRKDKNLKKYKEDKKR